MTSGLLQTESDIASELAKLMGLSLPSPDLLGAAYCAETARGALTQAGADGMERSRLLSLMAAAEARRCSALAPTFCSAAAGRRYLLQRLVAAGEVASINDRMLAAPTRLVELPGAEGALLVGSLPTFMLRRILGGAPVEHRGVLRFLPSTASAGARPTMSWEQWLGLDDYRKWREQWHGALDQRMSPVQQSRLDDVELRRFDETRRWVPLSDMAAAERSHGLHVGRVRLAVAGSFRTEYLLLELGSQTPRLSSLTLDEARLLQIYLAEESANQLIFNVTVVDGRVCVPRRLLPPSLTRRVVLLDEWRGESGQLSLHADVGDALLTVLREIGIRVVR